VDWYGDPEELEAAARRVAADADGVRERARALVRSATATSWRGEAAQAFRAAVAQDAQGLDRAARELDEAAAELRAHAAEVRARLARLRALEDAVTGWVGDRLEALW
jgi:uncharacterized protein YukE